MARSSKKSSKQCGLCGATKRLAKTECCGHWICDDEDQYVLFSHARNSCSRNHRRFTLCGHHAEAAHTGTWQECTKCRDGVETEMYVYYGTNEYNFEKLANPPTFEPTQCDTCKQVIKLGEDGFSVTRAGYLCEPCTSQMLARMAQQAAEGDLGASR